MAPKAKAAAKKNAAKKNEVTISATELAELRRKASAGAGDPLDIETIAKRPYRTIKASDGGILCYPPSEGGPWTIGGVHPEDWYAANEDGVATQNDGS